MSDGLTPSAALRLYASMQPGEAAWRKWTTRLGPWIIERTEAAQRQAWPAKRGPNYAAALEEQFRSFYPIFKKLSDNGTISFLRHCLEKLDAINAFREGLPEGHRPSHPRTVWKAWQAAADLSGNRTTAPGGAPRQTDLAADGQGRRSPQGPEARRVDGGRA